MVAALAVATVISFVVSLHSTSPGLGTSGQHGSVGLMPWLLLTLTVLLGERNILGGGYAGNDAKRSRWQGRGSRTARKGRARTAHACAGRIQRSQS